MIDKNGKLIEINDWVSGWIGFGRIYRFFVSSHTKILYAEIHFMKQYRFIAVPEELKKMSDEEVMILMLEQ